MENTPGGTGSKPIIAPDMPRSMRISLVIYFFVIIAASIFILISNWQSSDTFMTEKHTLIGTKVNQTISISKNQTSVIVYNSTSMMLPNGNIQKSETLSVKPISFGWSIFGYMLQFTDPDIRYVLTAALFGILGSATHGVNALTVFAAKCDLKRKWGWWYLVLPLVGLSLAVIVFVSLRAGLFTGSTVEINYYGIAAISALVGLSTSKTMEKLKEMLETFFGTSKTGTNTQTPKNEDDSSANQNDKKSPTEQKKSLHQTEEQDESLKKKLKDSVF